MILQLTTNSILITLKLGATLGVYIVQDLSAENNHASVKFMHPKGPSKHSFDQIGKMSAGFL